MAAALPIGFSKLMMLVPWLLLTPPHGRKQIGFARKPGHWFRFIAVFHGPGDGELCYAL